MTDGFLSLYVINDKFWQPPQFPLAVVWQAVAGRWSRVGAGRGARNGSALSLRPGCNDIAGPQALFPQRFRAGVVVPVPL